MALNQTAVQEIDDATMESVRRLVFARTGISLKGDKRPLVGARLARRMRALGIPTYAAYLRFVETDRSGDELVALMDAISTNVTSFFREDSHFAELTGFVQRAAAGGQRRFRLWSAASSSGEEPYSIAMTMREALPESTDVRILGTDISTIVLKKAMAGVYPGKLAEQIPTSLRRKYTQDRGGELSIAAPIRDMVAFRRANLSELPLPIPGPMDVIFCRNVMIYFENELRAKLVAEFFRILRPGGLLIVGHSESLAHMQGDFRTVRASVYLKPEVGG